MSDALELLRSVCPLDDNCVACDARREIATLRAQVEALREQLRRGDSAMSQALNEGNGIYKP